MKEKGSVLFMIKQAVKYVPSFCLFTVAEGIVWGCIHSFTSALFIKALFDRIESGVPYYEILLLVLAMAVFLISAYIFHECYWQFIEPKARQELHKKMQEQLYKKAASIDLACYDRPDFYNDFVWAINEADSRTIAICEDIGKIINRLITSAVIIGVLFTIDLWIVAAVLFSVVFSVVLQRLITKIYFKRDNELKPFQRRAEYISRVHYLTDYAKEIRMSEAEDLLLNNFDSAVESNISITKSYGNKLFFLNLTRSIFTAVMFDAVITILLLYKMMIEKSVTLGGFAATFSAMWKLFWTLNNLMDYFAKFKEHKLYANKFRVFLNYEPTVCDKEGCTELTAPFKTLELKNVSFAYPEAEKNIINGINMTVKAGQKIALVGYNGAGKSTLVKLLLRLYDVSGGDILINGKIIKDYTLCSYRNKFGTVFQDFQLYAADIAENVLTDEYSEGDQPRVLEALKNSGFEERLSSLNEGIHTPLTKEFDQSGINLSGGEAQKVAISRVFAKDCEIVILDEPSSALDPMTEYELNNTLMTALDKTVIIISHRLSTTRMADVIYMLENGEIIEQGSHDELMQTGGKYAEMFLKQAEKYNF